MAVWVNNNECIRGCVENGNYRELRPFTVCSSLSLSDKKCANVSFTDFVHF